MKNNKSLSNDYTTLNSAILLAAQDTSNKERTKNKVWFHHSELILLPEIQHQDHLLHHLWSKNPSEDTTVIKVEPRAAQNVVSDYVSLAKAAWSTHQEKITQNMRCTPKDEWASVQILEGGMTSHHEKPTVMQLKLTNGELVTTDAENASVMGPHLEKVYRNHRPIDWAVLHEIPQLYFMLELDTPISWK